MRRCNQQCNADTARVAMQTLHRAPSSNSAERHRRDGQRRRSATERRARLRRATGATARLIHVRLLDDSTAACEARLLLAALAAARAALHGGTRLRCGDCIYVAVDCTIRKSLGLLGLVLRRVRVCAAHQRSAARASVAAHSSCTQPFETATDRNSLYSSLRCLLTPSVAARFTFVAHSLDCRGELNYQCSVEYFTNRGSAKLWGTR